MKKIKNSYQELIELEEKTEKLYLEVKEKVNKSKVKNKLAEIEKLELLEELKDLGKLLVK